MGLESIGRLMEWKEENTDVNGNIYIDPADADSATYLFDMAVLGIVSEVDERYMERPVDADGVPIHKDDEVDTEQRRGLVVSSVVPTVCIDGVSVDPGCIHHRNDGMVENMLWELLEDVRPGTTEDEARTVVSRYAKSLRGLFE